jgi:spoIIIJ-associated protein
MNYTSMQQGERWLQELLEIIGISAVVRGNLQALPSLDDESSDARETDSYWLTIDASYLLPEQISALIGNDGSVLDAIQYLANSVLNLTQEEEDRTSYTVELNGYRIKRQAEVQSLAEAAAMEVRFSGREVEIKSLSSPERRQIHTYLEGFPDLETFSRGREPHRHLVVRPASGL